MSRHPHPISVRGGAGGIAADCAEMLAMARCFGGVAHDTLAAALQLHGYLLDTDTASALLDPVGYAQYEADLLDALDGLRGLTWLGAHAGLIDGELRVAAKAYEATDHLSNDIHDTVLGLAGAPPALIAAIGELTRSGNPIAAAQAALVRDPQAADIVVDALGIPTSLAAIAGRIPDGHGVVRNPGLDRAGPRRCPRAGSTT